MSTDTPAPVRNRLLAALPGDEHERLAAGSEPATLAFGQVLAEPNEPLQHVYFPTSAFISVITATDGRPSLEVGMIGDEGMLGASLVLGVEQSPTHALVQGDGHALCIGAGTFRQGLRQSPELQRILKRYLYVTIAQLGQTAACNRFHHVEARLARWLLMTHDRAGSDDFLITHQFLAYMLGVRRVGITEAASALQARDLIRYQRGSLTVLDRDGLEAAACHCYAADREAYTRIMD